MNTDRFRDGQRAAFNICMDRIIAGEQTTSIVLPTRYGKSDLMRCVAFEASRQGAVAGSAMLSPGTILRDQGVKPDKVADMARRYELDMREALLVRTMRSPFEQPFPNGEYLISSTFELATRRIDQFAMLANSIRYTTGKPLLLFIDECHEASEQKRRGEFVSALLSECAQFVLVTATPIRADKEIIPGFRVRVLDEDDACRFVVSDAGDGVHNRIDVYEGRKDLVVLDADHVTTFKEAWNENPSPLCHLSREVVDVDISELDGEEPKRIKLSEAPMTTARRLLGKATRDRRVMARAVDLLVDNLLLAKRANSRCAAIVFTGNDDADSQDNAHARKVKALIEASQKRYKASLDVQIVTMKSESADDEKATQLIQRFVGTDGDNGKGDILIVKQMAGRGLDSPRVKVVLDLSSVRTVSSVVQRIMRCATPYQNMTVGVVVTLADPMMSAIWKQQVSDEGGEEAGEWRQVDMEWQRDYLKEKGEDNGKDYLIDDADLAVYDDSHGHLGDMGLRPDVERICVAFPEMAAIMTRPEIQRRWISADSGRLDPIEQMVTVDKEIVELRLDINERAKGNAGPYPGKENKAAANIWSARLREEHRISKQAAGLDPGIQLEHITSVDDLRRVLNVLENRAQKEFQI